VAQHKSAEKRNRQNIVRKIRNNDIRSRMRTAVKAARAAITDQAENKDALVKKALSEISRAASKNVLKKSTAGRYMSRLMRASVAK
jgi:small subunit ribosomal protein S20